MKPDHTRSFNREHAEAGAPICCANGTKVEVLRWLSGKAIGIHHGINGEQFAAAWSDSGQAEGWPNDELSLVMTPLGMIEGKPVWWDSEFLNARGVKYTANQTMIEFDYSGCKWPPAAPVIETKMTGKEAFEMYCDAFTQVKEEMKHSLLGGQDCVVFANLVIQRFIADGQVVPKAEYDRVVAQYNEMAKANFKLVADVSHRGARDMAIAEAVRDRVVACFSESLNRGSTTFECDLRAIVAKVPS